MKPHRFLIVAGLIFASLAPKVFAEIRYGVESTGNSDPLPPSTPGPAPAGSVIIDFDDLPQPPVFLETTALRDEYAGLGVTFSGPNPLDGGAILDQESNFVVSGYSAPNFLAFNCDSHLSDGGIPTAPERLTFSSLVSFVGINVGSFASLGDVLTMEAFNDNDQLVDTNSVVLQPDLLPLTVAGDGIRYVVIGQVPPCVWVADDLSFEVGTVSVEPMSWGRLRATYR
jgi:hypothetical protein